MHYFGYEVIDTDINEIIKIDTTVIETILGDTAIDINSKDERYKHPFIKDRKTQIFVHDENEDLEEGTGCVKITPAHCSMEMALNLRT